MGESEFSACNSSAMNGTKLAAGTEKVRCKCCADPCPSGAIWGLSLKLPTRQWACLYMSSADLVDVEPAWEPDVGTQCVHSSLSARSSFPQSSTKQREQDCTQPANLAMTPSPCPSQQQIPRVT